MAYQTRSLAELSQQVRGAFRQYLPGTDATLRQNVLYVLVKVLALLAREYELRLAWLYRQLFLSTADDLAHVRMHAADYRIYQKAAAPAAGSIVGTGAPGATYPAGVRYLSAGVTYLTTSPFTADGAGAFAAAVRAEGTGALTNREEGAVLALADAALNPSLSQQATVAVGGLGGGADAEGIESLRERALIRKAAPPQGAALPDYERFARDVPGVLNAWAYQFTDGIGSIAVYILFDGRPNNIPTAADLAVVPAAIDARRLIRVDDAVVLAPVAAPVDVTIEGLSMDTPEIRAAITANLRAVFTGRVRPGIDSDPFVLSASWLSEAISTATGEDRHRLLAPTGDPTFTGGAIPVLGAVTYA